MRIDSEATNCYCYHEHYQRQQDDFGSVFGSNTYGEQLRLSVMDISVLC